MLDPLDHGGPRDSIAAPRARGVSNPEPWEGSAPPAMGSVEQSPATPDALLARNPERVPLLMRLETAAGAADLHPVVHGGPGDGAGALGADHVGQAADEDVAGPEDEPP